MARTTISVQRPTSATPYTGSYTTMTTGSNNGVKTTPASLVHVKNGTAGAATLTVITPGAPGGNAIADKIITIPANSDRFLDLSDDVYRNSDGFVYIDSDVAVTVATFASP